MFKDIIQLLLRRDKVTLHLNDILKLTGSITHKFKDAQCNDIKGHTIFETKSSIVLELKDGSILKCLKIRHWTEYHKFLLGKNRAEDEVLSNYKMHKIGLTVPEIVYYGVFSNVLRKRKFSSFYCMRAIPSTFTPGNEIFNTLGQHARDIFIRGMILDINKLKVNNLVYSDLSLRNVLLDNSGKHYWIDTQVKKYLRDNSFKNKFNHSLIRFIDDFEIELNSKEKYMLHSLVIS
jgi:hypothetical protein